MEAYPFCSVLNCTVESKLTYYCHIWLSHWATFKQTARNCAGRNYTRNCGSILRSLDKIFISLR